MLPNRRKEAHEEEGDGLRVGFEVRVIGEVREVPASEEPGELEIGLQIGSGQKRAEPLESPDAPVQRLEADVAPEPLRARRISEAVHEVGPADPYMPREGREARSLGTMTFWMAAGTCILTVTAVAAVMSARKKQAQAPDLSIVFAREQAFSEERSYFLDHMVALTREAETLLGKYAAAKTPADVLPLVRDPSRIKERLTALWHSHGGLGKDHSIEPILNDGEVRPALILKGHWSDFSPFSMVFIRENGRLVIDWEASEGIGDAELSELRASKSVVKSVKVRVTVTPGDFYTPQFPESDYRSYQLVSPNKEAFVWAFVRRSSRTADLLEAEFNESSVLLEKGQALVATLRISGPLHENVNIFEITEMLHKGWISP